MTDRRAIWHARYEKGESAQSIAASTGLSKSTVASAISKYEKLMQKHGQLNAPTRAQRKASDGPKMPSVPRRAEVDLASVQRFDAATQAKGCLWIDGDLRDGSAVVCGHTRAKGVYCADHAKRVYDERPVSKVYAP